MKKRLLSILLVLCMVLTLSPAAAFADADDAHSALPLSAVSSSSDKINLKTRSAPQSRAATYYDLWVSDTQFSSENLSVKLGNGTASYNPSSKTLTLNNITFSFSKDTQAAIQCNIDGLTVKLTGTNTINISGTDVSGLWFLKKATITNTTGSSNDKLIINFTNQTAGGSGAGITTDTGAPITTNYVTFEFNDKTTAADKKGYMYGFMLDDTLTLRGGVFNANGCNRSISAFYDKPLTIENVKFNISATARQTVNYSDDATTSMGIALNSGASTIKNCSGTITAIYPLYVDGTTTVENCDFTLNAVGRGSAVKVLAGNFTVNGGKQTINATSAGGNGYFVQEDGTTVKFDNSPQITMNASNIGIQIKDATTVTVKSGTINITAECGVNLSESGQTGGSSFKVSGGAVNLKPKSSTSIGIYTNSHGDVSISGGTVTTENMQAAISNEGPGKVLFSGGEHTLSAVKGGYGILTTNEGATQIQNADIEINALRAIQSNGYVLIIGTDTQLTLNYGEYGIRGNSTGSGITITAGTINANYKSELATDSSSAPRGIYPSAALSISGGTFNFSGNDVDVVVPTACQDPITGGTLNLNGDSVGLLVFGNSTITNANITYNNSAGYGVYHSGGTLSLASGKLTVLNSQFGIVGTNGSTVDFCGADVSATGGMYGWYGNTASDVAASSYKVSGGTVTLIGGSRGAGSMYTSIPSGYRVYAGSSASDAKPVPSPTASTFNSKYLCIKPLVTYTLSVADGSGTTKTYSYEQGTSLSFTAAAAPSDKHFVGWQCVINGKNAGIVSYSPNYTGSMPAGDTMFYAIYDSHSGGTATCTKLAKCDECNAEYGILRAHSFTSKIESDKYLVTKAGCETEGVYYLSCSMCGVSAKDAISNSTFTTPALGHSYGNWTSNGYGTHSKVCARNASHVLTESCSGGTATCTTKATCKDCGGQYGDLAAHTFTAKIENAKYLKTAGDCEHASVYYTSCSKCGLSSKDSASPSTFDGKAPSHALVNHPAKAATCTSIGWDAYVTCSNCDYSTYKEIKALGHDEVKHTAKAATCTAIGWDAYVTCSRCDYSTYKEIKALGHDEVKHAAKAATCTAVGWDAYVTCSRCDYSTYKEINALGHNEVKHAAKAATCTAVGWDAYVTCSRCDYSTYKEINALGHNEVKHAAQAATCTAVGWDAYVTCSRCGYSTYKEIKALGHSYQNGVCTVCGEAILECPSVHYTDCTAKWYHEAIDYVTANKLMTGMSADLFMPGETLTRGMMVTVLYRLAGSPAVDSLSTFSDVPEKAYYAKAIAWAQQNGIVNGMTKTEFAPNDPVTREQIATILWRYEGSQSASADLSSFADGASVSKYAVNAMKWSVAQGLFRGDNKNMLNPVGNATRAEFATIIMRYVGGSYPCPELK